MSDLHPNSLTVDEAVALLINLDYIPEDFTLQEFLAAFVEEAEVEYENAKFLRVPEKEIKVYQSRVDACKARLALAKALSEEIISLATENIESAHGDELIGTQETTSRLRVEKKSLLFWAISRYGISVINDGGSINNTLPHKDYGWNDLTIYIRQDCCLGYKIGKGREQKRKAYEIGFGDKRLKQFNVSGGILLGLSENYNYPSSPGRIAETKERKNISVIRSLLRQLTGIAGNPFEKFNPERGYLPKFTIKNRTNISNERAESEIVHVPYEDGKTHSTGFWETDDPCDDENYYTGQDCSEDPESRGEDDYA